MIAAVAWPYRDLGVIELVSIFSNEVSSQFLTILFHTELSIVKEDFHVTI